MAGEHKLRKNAADMKEDSGEMPPSLMPRQFLAADLFDHGGQAIRFEADASEKPAIAAAFGLDDLRYLRAVLTVKPAGNILEVTGQVSARVTQTCVVSLEPFDYDVEEAVDVRFSDDPAALKEASTDIPGNEADWVDPPDPITGGTLDLGGLALEHLALGVDPYPRKPGVEFEHEANGAKDADTGSPFEALRVLAAKDEGGQGA